LRLHRPRRLLEAQARHESRFGTDDAHRQGVMQIIPSTARELGLTPADVMDPQKNIMAGAQYLKRRDAALGVTDWNDRAQQDRAHGLQRRRRPELCRQRPAL
jgi:soluble lytic murein transglycosylase-like protein